MHTKLSANTKIASIALLKVESLGLLILCQNSRVVMPKLDVELGISKHYLNLKNTAQKYLNRASYTRMHKLYRMRTMFATASHHFLQNAVTK